MVSTSRYQAMIFARRFPSTISSARCGWHRANSQNSGGRSAGGHLAACMLATDWRAFDATLPDRLVAAAYAISGLFDLRPLVKTSINNALELDEATAKAASPLFWNPPLRGSLDAVVGANESSEYLRQSRAIVDAWGAAGVATRFATVADANHFTAIAPLADRRSAMTLRLKELAGRR